MTLPISPLAPHPLPQAAPIAGAQFFTARTGLKYQGRDDLFVAQFCPETLAVGSFTQNQFVGAPVTWTRQAHPQARALIVNAGNANVANGAAGDDCVAQVARALSEHLHCQPGQIWQASTGVIGEALEAKPLIAAANQAVAGGETGPVAAAAACLTTDTFAKMACRQVQIDGQTFTLSGFAKGSGMIQPNMATMLAFVFTDAALDLADLQTLHQAAIQASFNAISVDSDTSTSDMALTFATGQAGKVRDLQAFGAALKQIYQDLAQLVVRDGEGASKFIEIEVSGAVDQAAARALAFSVANSPLFKTAMAGQDANWGRILMALGKAGVALTPSQIQVYLGPFPIVEGGARAAAYREPPVATYLKGQDLKVGIRVGQGPGAFTAWTCDLTHGYISINADYRS